MDSERLANAIQLIRAGYKQAALPILKEIVQANPRDENAWLWLSSCVDNPEQKKDCLQKVLEINPINAHAQNAMRELTGERYRPVRPAAPIKETRHARGSHGGNRNLYIAIGAAGALLLVCSGALLTGQLLMLAASPTSMFPPTATFTLIPSPTYTATATIRPSPTLSPVEATPTLAPTIPPFTPGNPTATPLGGDITDPGFNKGITAYHARQYEEAIGLMNAVIESEPELAPPYRYRGISYEALGDCTSGMADMEKALAINPDYAAAWGSRGHLNECLGKDRQALLDYQKAFSLDPSLAFVYYDLGVYYFKNRFYEKSLEEYNLSLSIDPTRPDAQAGKREVLIHLGLTDEGIRETSNSIALDPKDWSAYGARGYCELGGGGKLNEAIADFKISTANIEDNYHDLYNLGVAYFYRGYGYYTTKKYNLAVADLNMAVKLAPRDAPSFFWLAYADFEVGDYQGVLEAGKSSMAIDPTSWGGQGLLDRMGRASYFLGDYNQAIDYMGRAIAFGEYPLEYYYRGISYQAAGKNMEAIRDLKYFLFLGATGKEADDAIARLAKLEG